MQHQNTTQPDTTTWSDLLKEAVTKPGMILEAYRAGYGYSLGNQMLALMQSHLRGIRPGPISTYPGWQAKGRQVRTGEKAIVLCLPITCKRKAEAEGEETAVFTRLVYKPHWLVMSQTDGEPVEVPATPEWNRAPALEALGIREVAFDHTDGKVIGFATGRELAISPSIHCRIRPPSRSWPTF